MSRAIYTPRGAYAMFKDVFGFDPGQMDLGRYKHFHWYSHKVSVAAATTYQFFNAGRTYFTNNNEVANVLSQSGHMIGLWFRLVAAVAAAQTPIADLLKIEGNSEIELKIDGISFIERQDARPYFVHEGVIGSDAVAATSVQQMSAPVVTPPELVLPLKPGAIVECNLYVGTAPGAAVPISARIGGPIWRASEKG